MLSAFADGVYANPNQRRLPPTDQWTRTWDVGVQLTLSPNDIFVTPANVRIKQGPSELRSDLDPTRGG